MSYTSFSRPGNPAFFSSRKDKCSKLGFIFPPQLRRAEKKSVCQSVKEAPNSSYEKCPSRKKLFIYLSWLFFLVQCFFFSLCTTVETAQVKIGSFETQTYPRTKQFCFQMLHYGKFDCTTVLPLFSIILPCNMRSLLLVPNQYWYH